MNLSEFPGLLPVTAHTSFVGPGTTFVVIKGMKEHGASYIPEAIERGATTIVIQQDEEISPSIQNLIAFHNVELIFVLSARRALAELSAKAHGYPAASLKLIGITGTKGKTTTAFLIEHMLRSAGCKTALISTVENRILSEVYPAPLTTPQPDYLHAFFARCRAVGVEYVIMEVAAQALSLDRLVTLSFDATVFTNFSLEHSEFYSTQEDYFHAKCSLFLKHANGRIYMNADDEKVAAFASHCNGVSLYSLQGKGTLQASVKKSDISQLVVNFEGIDYEVHGLLGDFSAYNIVAACCVVQEYVLDVSIIQKALVSFEGVPGRLQRFVLPNNAVAFIDNAHTPSSFDALLGALRPLTDTLIVIFGAGGDRDVVKRPLMGKIAAHHADHIFLTTDNPRSEDPEDIVVAIAEGIHEDHKNKIICELDRKNAITGAYALSGPGTIIALLGKGPVEYQEIKGVKIPFSEASILRAL
ncbi:UDP-N-acetylmuramoyl-L-alanyl-D-glutamate--2,6-diaminopimelate ligase [Candidatus Dependentiae bacterium]|nr:UDP-N-acetylmuramoyl-L-alanyl-D-glutamate--2,6-diaminopimelate ligase [Candidatus Dependentiae bacterium]